MADTFYVRLELVGKKGAVTVPFVCIRCGDCCKLEDFLCAGKLAGAPETYPQAHAKANAIYKEMGDLWAADETKYDQYIQQTNCPFLKEDKTCAIYEIRPEGCRQFPNTLFGRETQDCPVLNQLKKQYTTPKGHPKAKLKP
jgi:Fe-S-cluster containining protein